MSQTNSPYVKDVPAVKYADCSRCNPNHKNPESFCVVAKAIGDVLRYHYSHNGECVTREISYQKIFAIDCIRRLGVLKSPAAELCLKYNNCYQGWFRYGGYTGKVERQPEDLILTARRTNEGIYIAGEGLPGLDGEQCIPETDFFIIAHIAETGNLQKIYKKDKGVVHTYPDHEYFNDIKSMFYDEYKYQSD